MKRILSISLLTISILCTFVACEPNVNQDDFMSVHSRSSKANLESYDNLPKELGKLHNEAMRDFGKFCEENSLSPFKGNGFSDDTYMDFAKKYVKTHLTVSDSPDYIRLQEESAKLSEEAVQKLVSQLQDVIFNCDSKDVIPKIVDLSYQEQGKYNTEGESLMIQSFCNLALYSFSLWNFEWDWTISPLVPEHLAYTMPQSDGSEKNNDEKKEDEKEDQTEMKKTDYNTRKIAFVDLMGGVGGAALGGGWPGFAVGAIVASLTEYGSETLDAVALEIDPNDIDKDSYFYKHLDNKYKVDKDAFYKRYGNKFEGIIY